MEKLFAVYVGGRVEGCHVELHDMRFAVGATIEDCFDDLKAQWWGLPESLHLDAFGALETVDGFAVTIGDRPQDSGAKLFFVNLGGYDPEKFDELHRNVFVVASDWRAAKKKALALVEDWTSPHKDNVFEIETIVDVADAITPGRFVHLTPDATEKPFRFEARYIPIGKLK
jgi:hypothetical protein